MKNILLMMIVAISLNMGHAEAKPQCLALVDLLASTTKHDARMARIEAALPPGAERVTDPIEQADRLADLANSALIECSIELRPR